MSQLNHYALPLTSTPHTHTHIQTTRTGTVDYLVDALALHDHLHLLRPLMSDPAVLKVLHGGANDIGWLQRDAHVYLVNVFDTEKAALVSVGGEGGLWGLGEGGEVVLLDATSGPVNVAFTLLHRQTQTHACVLLLHL